MMLLSLPPGDSVRMADVFIATAAVADYRTEEAAAKNKNTKVAVSAQFG